MPRGAPPSFAGSGRAAPSTHPEWTLRRSQVLLLRTGSSLSHLDFQAKRQLAASGGVGADVVRIYVVVEVGLGVGRTLGIVLMLAERAGGEGERKQVSPAGASAVARAPRGPLNLRTGAAFCTLP